MKYYKAIVMRGHCGTGKSCDLTFYIQANNLLEAMDVVKNMPGIKHHRIPSNITEIVYEEFCKYRNRNAYHTIN